MGEEGIAAQVLHLSQKTLVNKDSLERLSEEVWEIYYMTEPKIH